MHIKGSVVYWLHVAEVYIAWGDLWKWKGCVETPEYIYIYIYMYVYRYVYVRMYVCMHICIYIRIHTSMQTLYISWPCAGVFLINKSSPCASKGTLQEEA